MTAAMHFFRALRVYPNPVELLMSGSISVTFPSPFCGGAQIKGGGLTAPVQSTRKSSRLRSLRSSYRPCSSPRALLALALVQVPAVCPWVLERVCPLPPPLRHQWPISTMRRRLLRA